MHHSLHEVGRWLTQVVEGHYRYYGVPRNYPAMNQFRDRLRRLLVAGDDAARSQTGRIGNKCMARISHAGFHVRALFIRIPRCVWPS